MPDVKLSNQIDRTSNAQDFKDEAEHTSGANLLTQVTKVHVSQKNFC